MQYLVSVITEGSGTGSETEMAAIDAFNDRLRREGHWVYANGLAAPDTATVIDNRGEEPIVTDGPYLETKEYIAGLWIIEAENLDVALEIATDASKACNRKLEVRPFAGEPA